MKNRSILILIFTFLMITVITSCTPSVPPIQYGWIDINSTPDGAKVFIDGIDTGIVTPVTLNEKVGSYTIKLDNFHYKIWEDTVTVNASETTYINPALTYASLDTIILQPGTEGKDADVEETVPDGNNADIAVLYAGFTDTEGKYRSYLQFDLSAVPADARVIDSKIELYLFERVYSSVFSDESLLGIYQVTESWAEDTITWNNQPASFAQAEGEVNLASLLIGGRYWESWNITVLVQGWVDGTVPNYGIAIKAVDETLTGGIIGKFRSSDFLVDPTKCPKLEIDYYIP